METAALILLAWVWVVVFWFILPKFAGSIMSQRRDNYNRRREQAAAASQQLAELGVQHEDGRVVNDRVVWIPGGPVPEDTVATWRTIGSTVPCQALRTPAPSPLFNGPFQTASDILAALPADATYIVQDYSLVLTEHSDEWIGSATLLVILMLPCSWWTRITFPFRAVDEANIRPGAFLAHEYVYNLLGPCVAAGKNIQVTTEPNHYYRQAMQLHHMASQTHETAAKLSSDVADKAKHSELSSEHARMSAHHKEAIVDMGPAASKEWSKGRMKEWASKKTR